MYAPLPHSCFSNGGGREGGLTVLFFSQRQIYNS
jgi:hypothetical protein